MEYGTASEELWFMLLPEMFTSRTCSQQMLGTEEAAHLCSTAKEMIISFRRGNYTCTTQHSLIVLVSDLDKTSKSELQLGNNSSLRQFTGTSEI